MEWQGTRVLLTGAAGGIGACIARELFRRGARLVLIDRDRTALAALAEELGGAAHPIPADLGALDDLPRVFGLAGGVLGGLDILVNNAGIMSFTPAELEEPRAIERLFRVNLVSPVLLSRLAVRQFLGQGSGRVVNVGSIFGSIAFPHFATYSSGKFGLRGDSEALRRELHGTGVRVTYVAPRATRTALADVFGRMAEAVGMPMDPPELVAAQIVRAIERDDKDRYLGGAERLFVRVNALLPRLVDRAVRARARSARPFAIEAARSAAERELRASASGRETPSREREATCRD
jgi:short-subunit dehydrogenase